MIVGINGIGKTTMLNLIYRLLVGPWDPTKAEDGVQLTRGLLTKNRSFDYFAKRDRTPTKGVAMGEFQFGDQRLSVTRRLTDLSVISLTIDDVPVIPKPTINLEDEIRRLSGCGRQYDFHLLVTSLLFFLEEKTPVVWDPDAQIEVFRILFLDAQAATELARLANEIQRADSRRRNMLAQLNSYRKKQIRAISTSSATKQTKGRARELETRADSLDRQLDAVREEALKLEETREKNRQKVDAFKLDLEEASRALEYLHHEYFASLFPTLPETVKNIFLNLIGDSGCTVCGSRLPGLSARFHEVAASGDCPVCGSPEEAHERFKKTAAFGAGGIARHNQKVAQLKEDVSELEALNAIDDERYRGALRQLIDLQSEHDQVADEAQKLRVMLPADEATRVEVENYIRVTEKEIAETARLIASSEADYKQRLALLRAEVDTSRQDLMAFFGEYAGSFLAENCSLIFKPRKLRLGEATELIEFPTFAVQMTSAVSPSSGVTRISDADVSESQKEFIDLAFRMAVLRAYASVQGSFSEAMIVIETPEASLDSVFIENAGRMLRNWCIPTESGRNSIVASCNLNRENMIAALLGLRADDSMKPSEVEVQQHLINLLDVAAENAALAQHRSEYLAELKNSTSTNG